MCSSDLARELGEHLRAPLLRVRRALQHDEARPFCEHEAVAVQVEAVIEETNLKVEELKGRIAAEKESAAAFLRDQVTQLSTEIARKVLGRPVA